MCSTPFGDQRIITIQDCPYPIQFVSIDDEWTLNCPEESTPEDFCEACGDAFDEHDIKWTLYEAVSVTCYPEQPDKAEPC